MRTGKKMHRLKAYATGFLAGGIWFEDRRVCAPGLVRPGGPYDSSHLFWGWGGFSGKFAESSKFAQLSLSEGRWRDGGGRLSGVTSRPFQARPAEIAGD